MKPIERDDSQSEEYEKLTDAEVASVYSMISKVNKLDTNKITRRLGRKQVSTIRSSLEIIEELHKDRPLGAVLRNLREATERARQDIADRLHYLLTTITNLTTFQSSVDANAAWMFIRRDDGLDAVTALRNQHRDEFLRFDEVSIVTKAFAAKRPIVVKNVHKDSSYRQSLPSTKSAAAIPVFATNGEVLGILHLESKSKWSDESVLEIIKPALSKLDPLVQAYYNLDRSVGCEYPFPWDGFHISCQLNRICHSIRRTIDENSIQCSMWAEVAQGGRLFVRSTTGIFDEFISEKTLKMESLNGAMLQEPSGSIGTVRYGEKIRVRHHRDILQKPHEYELPHGAADDIVLRDIFGWVSSIAIPIYAIQPGFSEPSAVCTFCISCFDERCEKYLPQDREILQIAQILGNYISGYYSLRDQLASVKLKYIQESSYNTDHSSWFNKISDLFSQIFDARMREIAPVLLADNEAVANIMHDEEACIGEVAGETLSDNQNKHRHMIVKFTDQSNHHTRSLALSRNSLPGYCLDGLTEGLARQAPFSRSEYGFAERLAERCVYPHDD